MNHVRTIGKAISEHHGFFSIDQIVKFTGISRRYCRDILGLFCKEGIIRQFNKGRKEHIPGKPPIYAMIYRLIDRKRLIVRIAPRRKERTIQDRMWYVMRNKFRGDGSFNLCDLILLAGAKKNTARWYLKTLHKAGYIVPSRKAGPGVEWKLTEDFGPERPYLDYSRNKNRSEDKN
jgi:Fic family protein